jgi:hypothetical protein
MQTLKENYSLRNPIRITNHPYKYKEKMPTINHMKMALLFISTLCFTSNSFAETAIEKNYFQFEVVKYHTTRQSGQTVNLYVKYAYKNNLKISDYPDYRELRKLAMKYLQPTKQLPENVYWEVLTPGIGKDLIKKFPIDAVSVQIEVLDNPSGNEPGNHGSIYTYGNIIPLDVHLK